MFHSHRQRLIRKFGRETACKLLMTLVKWPEVLFCVSVEGALATLAKSLCACMSQQVPYSQKSGLVNGLPEEERVETQLSQVTGGVRPAGAVTLGRALTWQPQVHTVALKKTWQHAS